jgi:hypothetical protein
VSSTLEIQAEHLISSIELCRKEQFITPSLMLAYATIDIMAWLNRDVSHLDVQRSDFIKWVDTYLLPNSQLSCTAIDLYAARCSLLHSYSAESRLSREGKASQLLYAWGVADEQELQKLIDLEGSRDAKAVQVEKLLAALKKGVEQFISNVVHNKLVLHRADKFFSNMPDIRTST